MKKSTYILSLLITALAFTIFFAATIIPELLLTQDIIGAFAAGFVNPFAAGYSTDVIMCWLALAIFVLYEKQAKGINYGWIFLLLGIVPGVVVGLCLYLVSREYQLDIKA